MGDESEGKTIEAVMAAAEAAKVAATVAAEAAKMASQVAMDAAHVASTHAVESAKVSEGIKFIKTEISEIKLRLDNKYVTIESFMPVKAICYFLVTSLGIAALAAIGKLIFIR